MARARLEPDDLARLLAGYRPTARPDRLARLAGSSKKGVYRVTFDDGMTAVVYAWSPDENYWPPSDDAPDDPFSDATGADLLAAGHDALAAAGVRTPHIYAWDRSRQAAQADLALVEDVRGGSLEDLMAADPAAAIPVVGQLGDALRAMARTRSPQYGKVALVASGLARQDRRSEDVILDRAMRHLAGACARASRLAAARATITERIAGLHAAVRPRAGYGLVHGELGPDHVLLTGDGQPVIIDIEGLAYFDVEWEHAFLRLRFRPDDYRQLDLPELDEARVAFYLLAHRIALIEGPLRIAETDFSDREWMLDLADFHIGRVLAEL